MKKILTLVLAALFCASMLADTAILSWYLGENGTEATAANSITGATGSAAEGWTIAMTGNLDKNWAGTSSKISYNGTAYKTLKNSNGVQNTVTLPEGLYASKVVFYAVTNNTETVGFLKEFDGKTAKDTVFSLTNYDNPTIITKELEIPKNELTFNFGGRQVCFIAIVTYSDQVPEVPEPPTPHGLLSWYLGENGAEATAANSITGATGSAAEGWTIAITGNLDKNWGAGGKISYNGTIYKTLKNSNGAQNTVTLPDGLYASKVVFYAITNDAETVGALKEFDGKTAKDTVFSLMDYDNPTIITKELEIPKNEFTFTFGGRQVCFLAAVTFSDEAPVIDSGTCGENLTWNLSYDSVLTISGTGAMENYKFDSIPLTPWNAYLPVIKSIVIADGVTSIGSWAFGYCSNCTSIDIPNSVTSIEIRSFSSSGLNSLNIPNSVTNIGDEVFVYCPNLTSIEVAKDNSYYSSIDGVLFNKNLTTLIYYPAGKRGAYVIPNSVISIGKYAFNNCIGLTSIEIPNSTTTIGDRAFFYCTGLSSVKMKNSVTSIGTYAFLNCINLTSITLSNSIKSIGNYAFQSCSGLTSVTIPNSVTSIGRSAFSNCTGLTSVTIPNSVTSIGDYAFYYCIGLIYITNHAAEPQTINADVFTNVNLSSVTLYVPAESIEAYQNADVWNEFGTIKAIGEEPTPCLIASGTCGENLTWELSCDSVLTISGTGAMTDYEYDSNAPWKEKQASIKSVVISDGVTSIGNWAFFECNNLTSIEIPNSVTRIGEDAFRFCRGLISIDIPNSVTSIEDGVFYACTSLTSVEIPNSVTSIGGGAFGSCYSLTSIEIPNSITNIERATFYACVGLTSITIPNSVTSIEEEAFLSCHYLPSITIPNSVTSIGKNAFSMVNNIVYSGSATGSPWGAKSVNGYVEGYFVYSDDSKATLLGCSSAVTGEIVIPNSVTSIGTYAFNNCRKLTSVIISNNVISIGDFAFYECDGLTAVSIPYSVTSIGEGAFYGCTGLKSVTNLSTNPQTIDEWVFGSFEISSHDLLRSCTLYVQEKSLADYQNADIWKEFGSIKSTPCLIASGTCGENLIWELSCDSVLTISGTGAMTDYDSYTSIPWWIYRNTIKYLVIGDGCTSIGNLAFLNCYILTSATIGNNVTAIGEEPFGMCYSLESITIPNSVTSIGSSAFYECDFLTSLTIPNSVKSIGNYAFYKCCALTHVIVPESGTSIGEYAFYMVPNVIYSGTDANAPWGAKTLNGYVDGYLVYKDNTKTYLTACSSAAKGEITIPGSVTNMEIWAFFGCYKLTSIHAASDNEILSSIDGVLFNKSKTMFVQYPKGRMDTAYSIPDGVTNIFTGAFYNCINLTSVTIPNSVTSIGDYAFGNCNLTSVINHATEPQAINANVFSSVDISAITLYVPVESLAAYQNAEVWKLFGTIMPIKDHISIAEAVHIGMALDSMATSTGTYTIEGYVINADAFSSKYKYQNWYMTDDPKSASSDFQAYQCYPVDNADTIAVFNGSKVRMTGQLHKYYNKATSTYIIEMKRVSATILALPETDTITVAEALAIGEKLKVEESTGVPYTIRGYVSYIETPFDEQYKNQSFYIADDISSVAYSAQTGGFHVYRGKPADGMPIKEGAFVELTATIKKYSDAKIENAEQNVRITILKEAPECRNLAGVCGDNLTWTLSTCDSALAISGTGAMYNYSKGEAPWSRFGVTSVNLGKGLTAIGKYDLYACYMPSIIIPASVTSIAASAFSRCPALTDIFVEARNSQYSSIDGVLYSKDKKTILAHPIGRKGAYEIPDGVDTIGLAAFNACRDITSITLPNSATTIKEAAFFGCGISSMTIPASVDSIERIAFVGCMNLTTIVNHAVVPQKIDSTVFEGVNLSACALYVPAESVKDYQTANVWKDFGSIIPMQAEEVTEPITDVETQPQDNSVIVTWPVVASADTYTLEIKKNGELICTLTFSSDGRLMGIAFAPARNGGNHAPAAIKTANGGLRFTVTGLNSGTLYDLDVIAKDDMNQTIKTYRKSFTTTGVATAIDNIDSSSLQGGDRGRLIYRDGQILILRGDRTYTLQGQEVK